MRHTICAQQLSAHAGDRCPPAEEEEALIRRMELIDHLVSLTRDEEEAAALWAFIRCKNLEESSEKLRQATCKEA